MNANELIAELNEIKRYQDRGITDYYNNEKEPRHETVADDYGDSIDEIIAILSRTKIRVTAEEKPTREDADKDGWVLAHLFAPISKETIWAVQLWNSVASDSEFFIEWTQLPEATP
jgi:hypothetical protein